MPFVLYSMPPDTFHPFSFTPPLYTTPLFAVRAILPNPRRTAPVRDPCDRVFTALGLLCFASEKTRLPSATSYTFFVWAYPPYRRSGFLFQCLAICSCVARQFHCNPSRAYYINVSKLSSTIV